MALEIVKLIYGIRRYGLHETLIHVGTTVPLADEFLKSHGFRINDRIDGVEWHYMSQPGGSTLGQAISHVEDVERHVDEAMGLRVGNNWPAL